MSSPSSSSSSIPNKGVRILKRDKSFTMDEQEIQSRLHRLTRAISEIHSHNASTLSYEELYRLSYNLVMQRQGDRVYEHVRECLVQHFVSQRDALLGKSSNALLDSVSAAWRNHLREISLISDILLYLDRTWIPEQEKRSAGSGVLSITELGRALFRTIVVEDTELLPRIRGLVLKCIGMQRDGEWVDLASVQAVFRMMADLGNVEEALERAYLAETERFYAACSQTVLENATCYEYCQFARRKLGEEDELAQVLLPEMTARVHRVVARQVVERHARSLVEMPNTGFLAMIMGNCVEELKLLFTLLQEVTGNSALEDCAKLLSEYISETGKHLLDNEADQAPALVVDALLAEKRRYDTICRESFQSHRILLRAVKEAMELFINQGTRCASYLAVYTDEVLSGRHAALQQEQQNANALDQVLDGVMDLFRYLNDKDVFEEYYKVYFAKRLLAQKSSSVDAERSMILKMKTECGHQFTSKLEGMFRDLAVSKQTCDKFSAPPGQGFAFEAQVLTSGYWPASTHASFQCTLPNEMLACQRAFEEFYLAQHSGRKITWNHLLGQCEVRATGFADGEQHEFIVTPLQCVLMLLLGDGARHTFAALAEQSQIPRTELKRQLISLCVNKFQIFTKLHGGKREFGEEDEYVFNAEFKSKLRRVRVPLVSMNKATASASAALTVSATTTATAVRGEEEGAVPGGNGTVPEFVAEARKHLMDASIVRIMKSRKRLEHNQLVSEVLAHLRFKPAIPELKKRIEGLIEREYLERDAEDVKVYHYLA